MNLLAPTKFLAPLSRGEIIVNAALIFVVAVSTINRIWGAGNVSPQWLTAGIYGGMVGLLIVQAARIIGYRRAKRRTGRSG